MHLGWQAKQRPDAIAVIESGGRTVTYAELDARSRQLAAALDLKPGDAIAIRMPSGAAFLEVALGRPSALRPPLHAGQHDSSPPRSRRWRRAKPPIIEEVYERLLAAPGMREFEGVRGARAPRLGRDHRAGRPEGGASSSPRARWAIRVGDPGRDDALARAARRDGL